MPVLLSLCLLLGVTSAMAQEAKDLHGQPLPAGAAQRLGTLVMRYGGAGGLAYLPDGRGVVLTGGSVDIWDLATGQRQSRTLVSQSALVSVQLRRDGKVLLLGDAAGTVHEWDPAALKDVRSWDTGQKELRTACYSPDEKRVLTAANNPPGLKEWDLESARELIAVKSEMVSIRAGAIYGPEGKTAILGGGYVHQLERWDLATGQLVKKWRSNYEAKHLALSPDGQYLLSGSEDRAAEQSLDTYEVFRTYKHCPGEAARIFQVAYLPATNEVLCGGRDGTIHRWSRETGEQTFSWRPHQSVVAPFAVSADEQWLLSYGTYQVAETNIRTGEPRLKWDRHVGSIEAVAFLPDSRRIVTGSSDETLRVWDAAAGKTLCVIPGAMLGAFAVAVSPDGKRVAAGCKDGQVREFDLTTGKLLAEYAGHLGYVRAVSYDRSGRLYSCADDGSLRVWEQGKPEAVAVLQGHRGGVLGLDVSPDGTQLVSVGRDGSVRLWDTAGRRQTQLLMGHAGWVTAVRFTPDGKGVLSGGRDGHLLKWDSATGRKLLDITRGSQINGLRCSPDGAQVFAAGGDGRVIGYNLQTGAAGEAISHSSTVSGFAISPDGRWLLTGAQDTTALLWQAPPAPEAAAAAAPPVAEARPAADIAAFTAPDDPTFGCDANPTGDPIGGGAGYRDIKTTGDFTAKTFAELRDALKQAKAGQTVFVPDGVEMDMTGQAALIVPGGVTLAGTRGLNGSLGPRLFSTTLGVQYLLRTGGDGVRITGLRFEGPYAGADLVPHFAFGISLGHHGSVLDNCEVYNFNCVGIGAGAAGDIHIHHNDIHHCQLSGYGYGVSTGQSNCFIIANKFDWCRHDIASGGRPGDAYEAAWNRVGENATSHRFDMHGGSDRGDATNIASDWMHIHHNTFLDSKRRAVVIRGVPSQGADIHHNWFAQPTAKDAVSSGGNTTVHDNVFGPEKKAGE